MSLVDHLPILVVLVPMFAAPLLAAVPSRGRLPWAIATLVSLLTFVVAVLITAQVLDSGTLHYELGGWPVPFGIGLAIGPLSALMLLVITGASLLALLWGPSSMDSEVGPEHQSLLYASWLLALCGLAGIAVTDDAFNIFVFMEISSLASYVMVAAGPNRQALTATFKYLIAGTVGATFYLIGVGYLYMMTGTLNLTDMAARLADVSSTPPVLMASGFILLGLALKAALFPMHAWMPDAYRFAPTPVAVFLAACSTKVALFVLIRFDFLVLHAATARARGHARPGAAAAERGRDAGRLRHGHLRARPQAHARLFVGGPDRLHPAGGQPGERRRSDGRIVHLFNHALIKGALFMAVGTLALRTGSSSLDDLAGIGKVHAADHPRFLPRRVVADRRAADRRLRQQVVLITAVLEHGWWAGCCCW
jgi:multicomponent Na+:H+ antiporter subunit D